MQNPIEYLRETMNKPEAKSAKYFSLFYVAPPEDDEDFGESNEIYIALVPHMKKPDNIDIEMVREYMKESVGNLITVCDVYTNTREVISDYLEDVMGDVE